jgi:hypothetical protein
MAVLKLKGTRISTGANAKGSYAFELEKESIDLMKKAGAKLFGKGDQEGKLVYSDRKLGTLTAPVDLHVTLRNVDGTLYPNVVNEEFDKIDSVSAISRMLSKAGISKENIVKIEKEGLREMGFGRKASKRMEEDEE